VKKSLQNINTYSKQGSNVFPLLRDGIFLTIAVLWAILIIFSLVMVYCISGFVKIGATDVIDSEANSRYVLEESGAPGENGTWRFSLAFGFSRLGYYSFSVRSFFRAELEEYIRDGRFIAFEKGPWNPDQERFLRTINAPVAVMALTQETLVTSPGDNIRISGTVQLSDRILALSRQHRWELSIAYAGYRVFDRNGVYHSPVQSGMGSFLTTTGMPIESSVYSLQNSLLNSPYKSPIEGVVRIDTDSIRGHNDGKYPVEFTAKIPDDPPVGFFRLSFEIGAFTENGWVKIENWDDLDRSLEESYSSFSRMIENESTLIQGPLFSIGAPADPKMIWTLKTDASGSQSRWIVAQEDTGNFALNLTGTHQGRVVLPPTDKNGNPIEYDLSPHFPTQKVAYGQPLDSDSGSTSAAYYPPLPLDPHFGKWSLDIIGPDGVTVRKDEGDFDEVTPYRASSGKLRYVFPAFGKYVVKLSGSIKDVYGHTYQGGGQYEIYIALPLSFSSSTKPGQAYQIGQSINPRLHIFPPGPTEIRFTTSYYPYSDPENAIHWEHTGRSNSFGYYFPKTNDIPKFDKPGEYKTDIEAWRWENGKILRYQHYQQTGIVYDPGTVLDLQGFRQFPTLCSSIKDPNAENAFIARTLQVPIADECSSMSFLFFPAEQSRLTLLSDPKGNRSVASPTFTWKSGGDPGFSQTPWHKGKLTSAEKSCFDSGCYCDNLFGRADKSLLPKWFSGFAESVIFHDSDHTAPIVSSTNKGYSPALYPEDVQVKSYCYSSAFRPGLTLRRQALEESAMQPYWWLAPNRGPYELNIRKEGDVENDHYRILGSCVRKEYPTGRSFYGYYAHAFAISPPESNLNGYFYNGSVPIVRAGGEDIYRLFGHSPEPGTIFSKNDLIAIGGFVLPTTAQLPVEFFFEFPDGRREMRSGLTNRYGEFKLDPVSSGIKPGMLWAKIESLGKDGVRTRALGTPDNRHLMFIAADHHQKIALNLRPGEQFQPLQRIQVIGRVSGDIVSGRAGYVRLTPGFVLDQDVMDLRPDGVFGFSFSLSQDYVKSKLYRFMAPPSLSKEKAVSGGEAAGNLQMGMVFVDGRDAKGGNVTASAFFMLKGNTVISVDSSDTARENQPSWPLYNERASIPKEKSMLKAVESKRDCLQCHKKEEMTDWEASRWSVREWMRIINWHRKRSADVFWPPSEDNNKIAQFLNMSPAEKEGRERNQHLIESKCSQCHVDWKSLSKREIRYTLDGWRRYIDYRYPEDRTVARPSQKYGFLRKFVPDVCVYCHSARIMQVIPQIEPLARDERALLAEALTDELSGEEGLPDSIRTVKISEGKRLYQKTCYGCHSLELKQAEKDTKLSKFAPLHLLKKSGEFYSKDTVDQIADYLGSIQY
jgi:hypothetical protein